MSKHRKRPNRFDKDLDNSNQNRNNTSGLFAAIKTSRYISICVASVLIIHTVLLVWSASRQSPTFNEPAHLVAGISNWQFGRFDLYRVNPPLVRMIAAIPVLSAGVETEWRKFRDAPGARPVFGIGRDFVKVNRERSVTLFIMARWACIPFSLLGGFLCYQWSRELYGRVAGLMALTLWCFSPNIIAHGQLITPDAGATAMGLAAAYCFWRWLNSPTWRKTLVAGFVLGLAQLTKASWLILLPLWTALWCYWQLSGRDVVQLGKDRLRQFGQLSSILLLAIYVLNVGYGFSGTLTKLGEFQFVSQMLKGSPLDEGTGNRFADSWLGAFPVPLPKNYVEGLDVQKRDFEDFGHPSYLRGEFRDRGWWYYFLYAAAIKIPLGTWLLAGIAVLVRFRRPRDPHQLRNEVVLLAPGVLLFAFVSSQTGFSHHFRYVVPTLPFAFIWISGIKPSALGKNARILVASALLWCIGSSLWVYPHSLSYFNELAGGPVGGHDHLINSNIDWGQDLVYLKDWLEAHPNAKPFHVKYYGYFNPKHIGINYLPVPRRPLEQQGEPQLEPGWYAVSVNYLRGYPWRAPQYAYSYFLEHKPVDRAGYSIYIYRVEEEEQGSVRN